MRLAARRSARRYRRQHSAASWPAGLSRWRHPPPGPADPGGGRDEANLVRLATLTSAALDALARLHRPQYQENATTW